MANETVAVLQSSYIPWKGYFDIMHDVDLFIFYDDVQFTRQDWRSRNRIKTQHGPRWLSVPVGTAVDRLICDVRIDVGSWPAKHYRTLVQSYARAEHFSTIRPFLEDLYLGRSWKTLSEFNQWTISTIVHRFLGLQTLFADSRDWRVCGAGSERLLSLLLEVGATRYVSGPSAKNYLDMEKFRQHGVEVIFKDYSGYPAYPQRFPPFEHHVTVLDLLCNVGPDIGPWYIWGWRTGAAPT